MYNNPLTTLSHFGVVYKLHQMQQQTLAPLPSFNRLFLDLLSVIASVYIYIYNKQKQTKIQKKEKKTQRNDDEQLL
jgi:hypothetical protein